MTVERLPALYLDAAFTAPPVNAIVLVWMDPRENGENYPLDQVVYLDLADVSAGNALVPVTKVWIGGVLAFDAAAIPQFQPGFQGVGSAFNVVQSPGSAVDDVHLIAVDNENLWSSEQEVEVRVHAESTGGYTLDRTYRWRVRDAVKPVVSDVQATAPREIEVTFNEPMLMTTGAAGALNPARYTLTGVDTPYFLPTLETIEQVTNYRVRLHFDQELSHGKTYRLSLEGIADDALFPNILDPTSATFVAADLLIPVDRDSTLWLRVPQKMRRWDTSLTGGSPGHTERLIECIQEVFDLLYYDIDLMSYLYDIDQAPMDSINLLLEQFGNPFKFALSDNDKRKLLQNLVYMYRQKGTEAGVVNAIFFFMGIPVTIVRPWGGRTWRIGYDKLGFTTYLGPADAASKYTFWIIVPVYLTTEQRDQMDQIVKLMKAAHEHHVIKEPTPPPAGVWRLGYDKLGIGTRLGG